MANLEDSSDLEYPRGSTTWFGLNGRLFERQAWLATSYEERGDGTFGVTLTGMDLVTARIAWARELKQGKYAVWRRCKLFVMAINKQ